MRKFIASAVAAAAILIPASAARADQDPPAHNAVLPCNIPVGQNDTIVSPGASDCIVQYASEADAAAVVHAALLDGRFVYSNDTGTGFISEQGGQFVVRVADTSPSKPLEVIFSPAS